MHISDALTKPASETQVMAKLYGVNVWAANGTLADWLGADLERVTVHEIGIERDPRDTELERRFEVRLDGALIGELRDDAIGRTYYVTD